MSALGLALSSAPPLGEVSRASCSVSTKRDPRISYTLISKALKPALEVEKMTQLSSEVERVR